MQPDTDIIAAIATAPGKGGIGVVRISGANLSSFAHQITGKSLEPRYASFCSFRDQDNSILDQGIALYFPGPHSFTGEDVVELQGHGGPAILQLILKRCLELGARIADPGEFTRRAFLNNKIDLAQAESVADLIDATTSQAAKSAMRSLMGEFSSVVNDLVSQLIDLRMLVEAMLDFPEEELDEPDISLRNSKLIRIQTHLDKTLDTAQQGSLLREGANIVLIGQPNVGKSSLLNRLSGEDVALVSDIAGTTRDVIRQEIQIEGVPFHILDTAGLRESEDRVEQMGMERTYRSIESADVILLLLEASRGLSDKEHDILKSLPSGIPVIIVHTKIDLTTELNRVEERDGINHVFLSAKYGLGVDNLRQLLLKLAGWHQESGVFMARERHLQALNLAKAHLANSSQVIPQAEFFAEELRLAQDALNSITGEFTADDLLGEIFSRFCIGK